MEQFKYDIAISLCKEDVEFADKLVNAINPNLRIFFYNQRQEELISQSGPEIFARTFKEESRIIVILSRKKWSETFYTEIERNAIIDRTMKEGYRFLMILPMVPGEIPAWYPKTYIYANPLIFAIEELVRFIEFKVSEEGGIVKPLILEDQYQNLLSRIEAKRNIINLQHSSTAIESVTIELTKFKAYFDERSELLKRSIFDRFTCYPFNYAIHKAHIGYGEYLLEFEFQLPGIIYDGIVTTQDVLLTLELSKTFGDYSTKKSLEIEQRFFYYTPEFQGWALPYIHEQPTNQELQVLFKTRNNKQYYNLDNPIRTEQLIDKWFQKLLSHSSKAIERYV